MSELIRSSIPCKDCLIIPICRHKQYTQLIYDCDLLHYYLYYKRENGRLTKRTRRKHFSKEIHNVKRILGTESWYFNVWVTNRSAKIGETK